MVKVFDGHTIDNITKESLHLNPGDLSGDLISGGKIANFGSTGIKDLATKQTLVVEDGKITVDSITVSTINSNFTVRGDVKIYGVLDAGFVRTTELITNQRYEKQFLEFGHGEKGTNVGTGLLWPSDPYNKQFVLLDSPSRFFSSESIEVPAGRGYIVNGNWVIGEDSLGSMVVNSNLTKVGILQGLQTSGNLSIDEQIFYNSTTKRFGIGIENSSAIFTVQDEENDIEIIIDGSRSGTARIGTRNTKSLELITDDQARISVDLRGDITFGHEYKDSTVTRAYGKLSVGVKNPREQFEVAGNIRFANILMTTGDEPPTQGSYVTGDIVWNKIPLPGSWVGWVCIQGGSPGMWKNFGNIAP
jgi:hypothetical protein